MGSRQRTQGWARAMGSLGLGGACGLSWGPQLFLPDIANKSCLMEGVLRQLEGGRVKGVWTSFRAKSWPWADTVILPPLPWGG